MKQELTFLGLGRMGRAMTTHLIEQQFTVHGYDPDPEAAAPAAANGVHVYETIQDAISAQSHAPRLVWLMVPAAAVDATLKQVVPQLQANDCIIDGGNSFFQDSLRRHKEMATHQIAYIDCGVSGGIEGARNGASVMAGGNTDAVERYRHILEAIATPNGFGHVGGPGAGHYVKMIHNSIEYGMMGALAEGMHAIERHTDTLGIDVNQVLQAYQHGSIISSNLLNWLARAYRTEGYLDTIAGEVPHGETEQEMEYVATHEHVPILDAALTQRKETRTNPSRIGTLISAMRNQFGGHATVSNHDN